MDSELSRYGKKAISIATTASSTPQQIAFGAIRRKAITDDPKWNGGNYYGKEILNKDSHLHAWYGI